LKKFLLFLIFILLISLVIFVAKISFSKKVVTVNDYNVHKVGENINEQKNNRQNNSPEKGVLENLKGDLMNITNNGKVTTKNKKIKILAFGDVMLDRYNRSLIEQKGVGYFTEKIERLFWGQDINLVNLEGPITNNKSVSLGQPVENPNHFRFTFDPEQAINFLQANRINLVNIGNNHILNFHDDGLKQTEDILEKNDISYFGDPLDKSKLSVVKEVNGRKIAFVSYNRFDNFSPEDIITKIKELKAQANFIIVYAHWGREYKLINSQRQQDLAHQFIDAGADLVIGSHSHVVQPIEVYKKRAIFYSLGNFVFDQYFSENVQKILGVVILLDGDGQIQFTLIPLFMQKTGQLKLMDEKQRNKFLQDLAQRSEVSKEMKEEIKKGSFGWQF